MRAQWLNEDLTNVNAFSSYPWATVHRAQRCAVPCRDQIHSRSPLSAVACAPSDGRFVARRGLTRLKRYQIDRVFLASGPPSSGRAREMWEADFDIVASGFSASPGGNSALPGANGGVHEGTRGGASVGVGGTGAGSFEVAEAEAVLVVSQVWHAGSPPLP